MKYIITAITIALLAGCATKNSSVNFSMWRSSAISGEGAESLQENNGGGSLTAEVPLK